MWMIIIQHNHQFDVEIAMYTNGEGQCGIMHRVTIDEVIANFFRRFTIFQPEIIDADCLHQMGVPISMGVPTSDITTPLRWSSSCW